MAACITSTSSNNDRNNRREALLEQVPSQNWKHLFKD
jgi:hypothetical protein